MWRRHEADVRRTSSTKWWVLRRTAAADAATERSTCTLCNTDLSCTEVAGARDAFEFHAVGPLRRGSGRTRETLDASTLEFHAVGGGATALQELGPTLVTVKSPDYRYGSTMVSTASELISCVAVP